MSVTLRGQLLVAAPVLSDPNFHRTVVLIAEHGEEGAMGLVLNRPTETSVGDAVPELSRVRPTRRGARCGADRRRGHRRSGRPS